MVFDFFLVYWCGWSCSTVVGLRFNYSALSSKPVSCFLGVVGTIFMKLVTVFLVLGGENSHAPGYVSGMVGASWSPRRRRIGGTVKSVMGPRAAMTHDQK